MLYNIKNHVCQLKKNRHLPYPYLHDSNKVCTFTATNLYPGENILHRHPPCCQTANLRHTATAATHMPVMWD